MLLTIFKSKIARITLISAVILAVIVVVGGGWYFSGVLEEDGLRVDNDPGEFLVEIVAITDSEITLRQIEGMAEEENLAISAVWGITNGEDYGQLGDVIRSEAELITREFTTLIGEFEAGDSVRFERSAYPSDPLAAHGLEYAEVSIDAPLGEIGAWHVEADSDTWAILVHGRTDNRDSSLKIIDDLAAMKIHSLTIDYRNDVNAPSSESGYYDFGTTEWEDVEAAVKFALGSGAGKIILVSYSMGGGVVVNYQLQSDLSVHTAAIVLEAPMLNFGRTVDKGAEERSVPAPITMAAKAFSTLRFGINWSDLDYLSRADEIDVPVLVIHGEGDTTVPVETSVEFANAIPDIVELHTFPEVGHVAVWNWHPDEYTAIFNEFVGRYR